MNLQSIYLFDRLERLVDVVSEEHLTAWHHIKALNTFEQAEFELPIDYPIAGVVYFGFFEEENFRLFLVTSVTKEEFLVIQGMDKAESDLRTVGVIKDKKPRNANAEQALTIALEGTGYAVGNVTGLSDVRNLNFYYISPADALIKVLETYQCEFRIRYTFIENRVTGRFIDLSKRFGKVSGKQFEYGDNVLTVVSEESADDVVTALIGRGKGERLENGEYGRRIEFTDILWQGTNEIPIFKPMGQNYLFLESARESYGLSRDGQLYHRWGVFVDESIEDPTVLLKRTYEELVKLSVPITTFKANILAMDGEADYGDSVAIIRDDIGIAFEARLSKVVIDKLNPHNTQVELGDYATLHAKNKRLEASRSRRELEETMGYYSQQLQAFYQEMEAERARKNAEIDEKFRLANLEFDNFKQLAEENAQEFQRQVQADINQKISDVREVVDEARSEIVVVGERSDEVRRELGIARSELGRQLTALEEDAATLRTDTRAALAETSRKTAEIEADLNGVTERFENLRIEDNLLLNSSFNNNLEKWNGVGVTIVDGKGRITGQLNRTTRTFQSIKNQTATDDIDQTYIASVFVKVADFEAGPTNPFLAFYVNGNKNNSSNTWFGAKYLTTNFISGVNNQGWVRFSTIFQVPVPRDQIARLDFEIYARDFTGEVEFEKVSLRRGDIDFGWQPSSEDLRSEIATYKRTAEESSAELSRQIQLADGKAVEAKSYAQQTATQFSTRLSSLETYKDGEGTRASQYLTASREETARQLEAERTSISANYVAKSTYIEDVRGTTQRLNEIKTTADTAKQNLATYQNTVDRKLSELTTSTQTLDGKISTASAKVDTVAGQIRTEINEVERKIPTSLGGQNLIKNGGFPVDLAHWTDYRGTHFSFTHHAKYKDGEKSLFRLDNRAAYQYTAATNRFALKRNTDYSLSFYGLATSNLSSMDVWYLPRKNGETGPFTNQFILVNARVLSSEEFEYVTVTFNSKDYDEGFLRFDNNGSTDGQMSSLFFGEVMLAEGIIARTYEPSQEEVMEEVKSIKTTITQTSQGVEQLSTRLATTVGKVTTAETKISQLINDVSSKVSQTDHDTLTGRMTSAETAITQNAQEISRRLTSTQVESAITGKGYQTKADVDNNITGRGYITSSALQPYATTTVLENKVRETADSFSRSITETRALIPSGESNLVKWGRPGETSEYANASLANHIFFYSGNIKMYVIRNLSTSAEKNVGLNRFKVERNTDYTLYFKGFNNSAIISMDVWFLKRTRESSADFDEAQRLVNRKLSFLGAEEVTVTFNTGNFDEGYLRFDNNGSTADGRSADLYFGDVSVKKGKSNNGWSPSVEELATVTALHSVRDTVDSHTRTIGAVGTAGSILDNVSKVTQTAAGLVQEVSGSNGLKTQVSQLAGSYAIQNLTKAGDILGQINLNQDGSVRINEGLISIGERTYIKDGVITSAKIGKGQIGTAHIGEIDAGIAKIINLDVSNIKGLDAEFIKAKIENAFIEWMKGKTITAQNEAMSIGLNDAFIRFKDNAKIEFNSSNNAIVRRRGTHTGFVHIADTIDDAVYACIGVTSSGDGVNSWSSGRFAGIRCFRSAQGTSHNAIDDRIEVYGDTVMFLDDFSLARGFVMYPTRLPNGKIVDLNRLVTSVEHLWNCWGHAKNGGMRPPQAIMDERATYQNYHYVGGF
ncbi:hypothetical protein HO675_07665 [Streptococcus suis]|nr:hypothetical protein [Streptococcus suis]